MRRLPKNLLLPLLFLTPLLFVFIIQTTGAQKGIVFEVTTDKSQYAVGEDVSITIKAINTSSISQTLSFSSSKQADYVINGKYRQSADKFFAQFLTSVEIPGNSSYQWKFIHKSADYKLEAGSHIIVGEVVGYGSISVQVTVETATPSLTITTASLPSATAGTPYEATVSASGDSGSYSWSADTLPPGLSLISAVCITAPCQGPATISGTPTTAGTYTFTITVTDGTQKASRSFTILVTTQKQDLSFGVLTDKMTYIQNENIIIIIKVKNNSSQSTILNFPSSYQSDYVIDGKFRWSNDKFFTQSLTSVTLEPFGVKEWRFTHTPAQYGLGVGSHTIVGEVVGYGSAETTINVSSVSSVVGYFRYVMSDDPSESFLVKMTNPAIIQQALDDLNGQRRLIVSGIVNSGDGGFNSLWNWHLDPATVILGENFIELCDARPSYVETHLPEWLGQRYCPWGARVNAVYEAPPTPIVSTQPPLTTPVMSATIQVQVNALNVREDATLSAQKIGLVRQGEMLKKIEERNGWVKIELSTGQMGWVFGQYVTPITTEQPPTEQLAFPTFTFKRNLTVGMRAKDVEELQKLLARDPMIYPEGLITGYFGSITRAAVIRFQKVNKLPATGFVGPLTRNALAQ